MRVHAHKPPDTVELVFEDVEELRGFVTEGRAQGAVLLELAEAPPLFGAYSILLSLESGFEARLEASVVQLFEGAGCGSEAGSEGGSAAFQLAPLSRGWELDFERRLRQATAPSGDHSEMTGVPPIVRIRQLNVPERRHLATKADRLERAVLLRDASPQVLLGLLTNPRIGADDIVQIIRNPQVSPGVIDRLAKENRWLANAEIQKALVRNPKTPAPIALRLVDSLPTQELRKLAKIQSGLRENLRQAMLRVYLKRSRR